MARYLIYKVTNNINNKIYVGQTKFTLNSRKKGHFASAFKRNSNFAFHRALRKYGLDNFTWEEIVFCLDADSANMLEKSHIEKNNSFLGGYNMNLGGGSNSGFKHSDETKKKMSEAQTGAKNYAFGKVGHCLGKSVPESVRRILAEKSKGNTNRLGKPHTEEVKKVLALAAKGNKHSLGKTLSEEQKIRISRKLGGKSVLVFTVNAGELIGEWPTQSSCARALRLEQGMISECLNGYRKSCYGYYFKYRELSNG